MDVTMFQQTIKYGGEHIFIQPFCDFFGIDYLNQKKVINRTPLLKKAVSKKTSIILFGDNFERIAVTKRGFITWVLQINDQIVHPNLKVKLRDYQESIFDWMFGSLEEKAIIADQYHKLKDMRSEYSRIGNEIQKAEKEVKKYLEAHFYQPTLFASQQSTISE